MAEAHNKTKNPIPVQILLRFIVLRIGLFAISYYAFTLYNRHLPIRATDWYALLLTGLFMLLPLQSVIGVRILARRYQMSYQTVSLLVGFLLIVLLICLRLALFALFMNADFGFGPGTCDPMPDGSAPTHQVAVYEHIRFTPFEVLTEFRTVCSCPQFC